MTPTHHLASRAACRRQWETATLLGMFGILSTLSACDTVASAVLSAQYAQIGKETARGVVDRPGEPLIFVYRRSATPYVTQTYEEQGKTVSELVSGLEDAGVPITEISSPLRPMNQYDLPAAEQAALSLCGSHPSWVNDARRSISKARPEFDPFLKDGVWSFPQICR